MMVRTAVRSTTARASSRVGTAVELLDRTGIIAASLPQRRRTEFESDVEPPAPVPAAGTEPHPRDMDHRPRAVVIHRRTKTWIGAAAGVALLAIGWFAGGTLANQRSETASVEVRQDVAGQPAVPPPVPPPVAPATVVIDVPAKTPAGTKHKTVPSSKVLPPVARSTPEPRVDPPAAKPKTVPIGDISNQFADLVKPYLQAKYGPLAASGAER